MHPHARSVRSILSLILPALILSGCQDGPPAADAAPGIASTSAEAAAPHPATADPAVVDATFPPAMAELSFESGGSKLNGLMYVANGAGPHPTVVLLHGYAGNERNLDLAQAVRRSGVNVLFFNYRGTWGSGGEFSMANSLEDAGRAVERVRSQEWASAYRMDPGRVALVGHSFGGFLGAITAADDADVACLAFLAGVDMGSLGLLARTDDGFRVGMEAALGRDMDPEGGPVRGRVTHVVRDVIDRADTYLLSSRAVALADRPLLLVADTRDEAVPKADHHDPLVAALREAGAERLTEVVLEDDHSFSAHRVELARRLVDWLGEECW